MTVEALPRPEAVPPCEPVACTHCGLPVPRGLLVEGDEEQFCCSGCRTVRHALAACGLEAFYGLRGDEEGIRAKTTGGAYAHYDDPAFREAHVRLREDGLGEAELLLEGVHCSACVWLVERLPTACRGVVSARLDLGRQSVSLVWDPDRVGLSRIGSTLDRLGYPSHPFRASAAVDARRAEDRRQLIRIGIAGACAGNAMLIAFALYGGMFSGMAEIYRDLFHGIGLVVTLIALFGPGRVFLRGALASLRTRAMHIDVPVAIALLLGTGWGAWNTLTGTGEVYYESLTAVIFLLLGGRYLQYRKQRGARDAVELLYSLTPVTARLVESEEVEGRERVVREVPIEALEPGSLVELRAGDSAPADGVLVEGSTEADLSLLTGESAPRPLGPGEAIPAGATNLGRPVVVEVTATGVETRAGRLMQMVEKFASDRAPIVLFADRVAHWFVVIVLAVAAATFAAWLTIDAGRAVEATVTLLIVTCPCALGLATPLAVVASIGRAARRGIFIKGGEALERLARPGLALFDKTGTLTAGELRVVAWHGDEAAGPLAACLERGVAHPVATAFAERFEGAEGAPGVVEHLQGRGVRGEVDGQRVVVGSPGFVAEEIGPLDAASLETIERVVDRALTPIAVAVEGEVVAIAGLGDPLRGDARGSLSALRRLGWKIGVLSGDHPRVAEAIAREAGLDGEMVEGGALPEQKAEIVRDAAQRGPVVMVGDGVNDAAALAAADVGIAVHGGAEASLAAAPVYLTRSGVAPVVEAVEGARRTVRVIRRNVAISIAYNLVAASLAVTGTIDPLIAAILMPASSLSVIALSFHARTFPSGDASPLRAAEETR